MPPPARAPKCPWAQNTLPLTLHPTAVAVLTGAGDDASALGRGWYVPASREQALWILRQDAGARACAGQGAEVRPIARRPASRRAWNRAGTDDSPPRRRPPPRGDALAPP